MEWQVRFSTEGNSMKSLVRAADVVLRRMVPNVRAGACVPEYGTPCGPCRRTQQVCESGRIVDYYHSSKLDCNGVCRATVFCYKRRTSLPCA